VSTEPVVTIGAVFTSLKVAVTAVLTIVALQLEMDAEQTAALIGAGAAITIAIGDILGYVLTRDRVTPVTQPVLKPGTTVNEFTDVYPTSTVDPLP
jgi:hypothetical protein